MTTDVPQKAELVSWPNRPDMWKRGDAPMTVGTASLDGCLWMMECTAEVAAAAIEKAMFDPRPRVRYRIGRDAKLVCAMAWLLPDRWMDALMGLTLNREPLQ